MPSTITRLMVAATVAAAALLLVAAMILARGGVPGAASRAGTVRPAQPVSQTVASVSRFSPLGRRWI